MSILSRFAPTYRRLASCTLALTMLMGVMVVPTAMAEPAAGKAAKAEQFEPGAINRTPVGQPIPPGTHDGLTKIDPDKAERTTEVAERRTAQSKTFLTEEGFYVTDFYPEPVHFKADEGKWRAIDNRLVEHQDQGAAARNAAGRVKVSLPEHLDETPARVAVDGQSVEFTLRGASGGQPVDEGAPAEAEQGPADQTLESEPAAEPSPEPTEAEPSVEPSSPTEQEPVEPVAPSPSPSPTPQPEGDLDEEADTEQPAVESEEDSFELSAVAEPLKTPKRVGAEIQGDKATYKGIYAGVDAVYTSQSRGLKEELILAGPDVPSSYEFDVKLSKGLTARTAEGGGVDFLTTKGQVWGSFAPPLAYDSSTEGPFGSITTEQVALEIVEQRGRELIIRLSISSVWLTDSARQFPVTLDPALWTGSSGFTFITSALPDSNFDTYPGMAIYGGATPYRVLAKPIADLEDLLNEPVQVIGASIILDTVHNTTGQPIKPVGAYRIATDWNPAQVTWNNRTSSAPWSQAGGDIAATAEWINPNITGQAGPRSWSIMSMTQEWLTGQWPDYGVMIKYANDASAAPDIHFQYDDPMFTVSWVHQSGMHDPYSFESFSIGEDRQAMVNLVSGSLQLTETDLALAGTGVDASVTRTYDSREPQPGSMKAGWAMWPQTRERIYELSNGDLWWMGGPHGSLIFPRNPDGTYRAPQGFAASLVKRINATENGFFLTMHEANLEYVFGSNGYPVWIDDRTNENRVVLYYTQLHGVWVMSSMVDTKGRVTTFEHLNFTQVTKVTDPAGRVHRYTYDAPNNQFLTSYTDPAGKVTRYEYLDDPMPPIPAIDKIIDPNGNETRFSYEPASEHYDPMPSGSTLYDFGYRLTSLTRVTNKTAGTGPTWGFNYTDGHTTVTDPNGHQSIYRFDELGRTTEIEDHLGGKVATTYNDDGFVTSVTDPAGKTTQYRRDAGNNVDQVTLPDDTIRTAKYLDAANAHYPTEVQNAQGQWVDVVYNGAGRTLSSTAMPANNAAVAEYNTNGTMSKGIDPKGNVTNYSYFANGDPNQINRPMGVGNQSFTYDSLSRLKSATDAKGQTTTYTYDIMDRLTRIDFDGGDYIVNVYDPGGRLTRRDDVVGGQLTATTFGYDAINRQQSKTVQGVTYTSTYDGVGNLNTLTDPNGTVDYNYDAVDRLTEVIEPGGATTTFGYDDAYRRNLISYPNGVTQLTGYDDTGKVTSIVGAKADATVLTSFAYNYQDPDTLLKTELVQVMTEPAGQTDYDYDGLDRLEQADGPHGTFSYSYDPNGNRLTQDVDGQETNYMYNAADQLCYLAPTAGQSCGSAPGGATTFDYDPNGNLTSQSGGRSLAYNSKDQNTSFTPAGGTAKTMAYLDTGQTERTQAGSATFSTGPLGLASATEGGSTDFYVRDPGGQLISRRSGSTAHYYLFDHLGSVVALTDAQGNAVNTYVYDPYGNHLSGTTEAVANPWQYAGGFKDEFSGYYKFGARYYDPTIGRWTQPDPSGMEANNYLYAAGNPVNFVDATGLKTNNKQRRERIKGLEDNIEKHREKIRKEGAKSSQDQGLIDHWEGEINTNQNEIDRIKKRLPEYRIQAFFRTTWDFFSSPFRSCSPGEIACTI